MHLQKMQKAMKYPSTGNSYLQNLLKTQAQARKAVSLPLQLPVVLLCKSAIANSD